MSPNKVLVVDIVGLTPRLLDHMPRVKALAQEGFSAELETVLPAVTCSVQATLLTGKLPTDHGIVGNGWYFRDVGEVLLWRQHNKLIQSEKVWETIRKTRPDYKVANICWWYAMGSSADITVTPRPIYYSDGKKAPDCYTYPPELHDDLTTALGTFPLFSYWGANANISSSKWIAQATKRIIENESPDLTLAYLPHLDYDLQRHGPDSYEAIAAAREIDEVAGDLIEFARARDITVIALSEYGITNATDPIDINRMLRREGLLEVYTQDNMEYLDPWVSKAFAVSDHQIAHIYVNDPTVVDRVRDLVAAMAGVDQVLDNHTKAAAGIDHERAGELVAVAKSRNWFTYYYWLDDAKAPDFARNVEIHRKPGYDPAELFFDPDDKMVKAKAGFALGKKKLGFRYNIAVVPLDPKQVMGSHGRLPESAADGPVFLCSDTSIAADKIAAVDVRDLIIQLAE